LTRLRYRGGCGSFFGAGFFLPMMIILLEHILPESVTASLSITQANERAKNPAFWGYRE
jgi:hypothetical protein